MHFIKFFKRLDRPFLSWIQNTMITKAWNLTDTRISKNRYCFLIPLSLSNSQFRHRYLRHCMGMRRCESFVRVVLPFSRLLYRNPQASYCHRSEKASHSQDTKKNRQSHSSFVNLPLPFFTTKIIQTCFHIRIECKTQAFVLPTRFENHAVVCATTRSYFWSIFYSTWTTFVRMRRHWDYHNEKKT